MFVKIGQPRDDLVEPVSVFEEFHRAVGMNRCVIPGRHDLAVLLLRRVPGRRHIGVGAVEDRQRLTHRRFLPLRVGLRHMAVQNAVLAFVRIEEQRQRRAEQPARGGRDEIRKARAADRRVDRRQFSVLECGRNIHRTTPIVDERPFSAATEEVSGRPTQ